MRPVRGASETELGEARQLVTQDMQDTLQWSRGVAWRGGPCSALLAHAAQGAGAGALLPPPLE